MSQQAFKIQGVDEVTHLPVRLELRLVTQRESLVDSDSLVPPRGFLPAPDFSAEVRKSGESKAQELRAPSQCMRQCVPWAAVPAAA